jgi:hypothetical protein
MRTRKENFLLHTNIHTTNVGEREERGEKKKKKKE